MTMKANVNINIRTTNELKTSASEVLHGLGLDMSTAVNIFLTQVVINRTIPFKLTAPHKKKQTKLGGWEGKIQISDDFNEPMDEYGRFESDPDYCKASKEGWEE
jgi:DNA-damage-inducible protein J